jgi:hypothetical protein
MVNMKYISQRLRQKLRNILPKPPRSIENIAMAPKISHLIG